MNERRPAQTGWRTIRRFAIIALPLALILALGGSLLERPAPSGTGGPNRHFAVAGIEFDYPSIWAIHDQLPGTSGLGATWAILGTASWDGCGGSDSQCYYDKPMGPATISVEVGEMVYASDNDICVIGATRSDLEGRGPGDAPATGSLTRIAGRPAVRTDYAWNGTGFYQADEERVWVIAAPGTTSVGYVISATYRGPGVDGFRAAVDRLLASVRISVTDGIAGSDPNADCAAPFPPSAPITSVSPIAPPTRPPTADPKSSPSLLATAPPTAPASAALDPDLLIATSIAAEFAGAQAAGNWKGAWALLAPRSQARIGSLLAFEAQGNAFNADGGAAYEVAQPTRDQDLMTNTMGSLQAVIAKEADLSRGYLVFIGHPNIQGASAGSQGLFVAPLLGGDWRVWIVH